MRIAVVSAPKSGNHWVKCLLGHVYGLQWLRGPDKATTTNPRGVARWVGDGGFPDGTILHQHNRFSNALADAFESAPARIVTVVRDPYDLFVSLFHWTQQRAERELGDGQPRPRDALVGRPIDHPDVLAFLADDFGVLLSRADSWLRCGRATVLRYEALHADPIGALRVATTALQPVPDDVLAAAAAHCRADNMRAMTRKLSWHVRGARVGDADTELSAAHFEVMRTHHADVIQRLGYPIR